MLITNTTVKKILLTENATNIIYSESLNEDNRFCVSYCYSPNTNVKNIVEHDLDLDFFDTKEEAIAFVEKNICLHRNSVCSETIALYAKNNMKVGDNQIIEIPSEVAKDLMSKVKFINVIKSEEAISLYFYSDINYVNGIPELYRNNEVDIWHFSYDDEIFKDNYKIDY